MTENELFQRPASYWLRRAERQRQNGDLLRAAVLERHALSAEPANAAASLRYVLTLRQLQCYEASNREAFAALSRDPENLDLFGLIGLNLYCMGRLEAAYDALNNYLSQPMPENRPLPQWHDEAYDVAVLLERRKPRRRVRRQDGLVNIAMIRIAKGDLPNARRALTRAQSLPGNAARREFAEALWHLRTQNPKETMLHLLYASAYEPKNPRQHAASSGVLDALGERKLAYTALVRALRLARTPEQALAALAAADALHAPHLAIGMLRRLNRREPRNAVYLHDLSLCLMRLGKLEEAGRHMRLCRELDPGDSRSELLFNRLQEVRTPEEARAAANRLTWHGMTNQTVLDLCVAPVLSQLADGVDALGQALQTDSHLRSYLFPLLSLPADWPAQLLWAAAPAMEEAPREAFLRQALLSCPDSDDVRRVCVALLDEMKAPPPYAAWKKGRIVWIDPTRPPVQEPTFRQRFLTRRLHRAGKLAGDDLYFVPWAMETVTRLGRRAQNDIIRDPAHIWPMALALRYRAKRGMKPMHVKPLNKTRAAMLCRALRLMKHKEEQAYADH